MNEATIARLETIIRHNNSEMRCYGPSGQVKNSLLLALAIEIIEIREMVEDMKQETGGDVSKIGDWGNQ